MVVAPLWFHKSFLAHKVERERERENQVLGSFSMSLLQESYDVGVWEDLRAPKSIAF